MSTTTFVTVPKNPEIPLTPDVLAAYKELYDQYESAIEATADTTLLEKLNTSQQAVADVINLNDKAILDADTAVFAAVLTQIGVANKGIDALKAEIAKVASNISVYAGILSGIDKVLSMVPVL
jgi:hypothetical protein